MEERQALNTGALATSITAFALWGILPAYWKFFGKVPAYEVLGHRIVWSFVFMILLVIITKKTKGLIIEAKSIITNRKRLIGLIVGATLISFNWLTYIWAVNHDRVVESSLGYYINPLLNMLMGVVIFRERLSMWQFMAVALAAIGVIYLTINFGSFPVVALILASTITLYSYCKKVVGLPAVSGMTLETAITMPFAVAFFIVLYSKGGGYPISLSPTFLLLVGAGAITAIPLIMFAHSLNHLPLTVLGVIQYISPTLTLLLGVFAYREVFSQSHLIAFIFIWSGLIIFSTARTAPMAKAERAISRFFARER